MYLALQGCSVSVLAPLARASASAWLQPRSLGDAKEGAGEGWVTTPWPSHPFHLVEPQQTGVGSRLCSRALLQ